MLTERGLSIHDVSRIELDRAWQLTRFNMPLELGADLGLRRDGPAKQRTRKILILDAQPHRYDKTLSDISGKDIEAQGNETAAVIKTVLDWLSANRETDSDILTGTASHHGRPRSLFEDRAGPHYRHTPGSARRHAS